MSWRADYWRGYAEPRKNNFFRLSPYWQGRGTSTDTKVAITYWIKGVKAGDPRGEAGDRLSAMLWNFIKITWEGPIGAWTLRWVLPILLGLFVMVLLLIKRERDAERRDK